MDEHLESFGFSLLNPPSCSTHLPQPNDQCRVQGPSPAAFGQLQTRPARWLVLAHGCDTAVRGPTQASANGSLSLRGVLG